MFALSPPLSFPSPSSHSTGGICGRSSLPLRRLLIGNRDPLYLSVWTPPQLRSSSIPHSLPPHSWLLLESSSSSLSQWHFDCMRKARMAAACLLPCSQRELFVGREGESNPRVGLKLEIPIMGVASGKLLPKRETDARKLRQHPIADSPPRLVHA